MNEKHILIDSHILLWVLYRPNNITIQTRQWLEDATSVSVSAATLWELCIKHKNGKLKYGPEELARGIDQLGLMVVPCEPKHIFTYNVIKLPHKDPFDTMLVAQAVGEGMTLLTADHELIDSPYKTIDARI